MHVKERDFGRKKIDCAPTLDVASVKLFKVVLLPDDGLPTRAMRGSRGITIYRADRRFWALSTLKC